MKSLFLFIFSISILTSCISDVSEQEAENLINKNEILSDVLILSSDDMEGRAPGTAGENKAAVYIQSKFETYGLEAVNGSYLQKFNLVGTKKNAEKSSLKIIRNGKELKYQSDKSLTYCHPRKKRL